MAWFSSSWLYRAPISVDFSGGAATADVQITIPDTFDQFWTKVASDGKDVRLVDSNGTALVSYKLSSWTYASKTGVIQGDNVVAAWASQRLLWLYWGNSAATDAQSVFSATGVKTGIVEMLAPAGPVVVVRPERPGGSRPVASVAITTEDVRYYYLDLRAMLRRSCTQVNGLDLGEEIREVMAEVRTDADSAVASAILDTNTRFIGCSRGRGGIVAVKVDGTKLTDATNYAIWIKVYTSNGDTLTARCGLYCRDVRPSA